MGALARGSLVLSALALAMAGTAQPARADDAGTPQAADEQEVPKEARERYERALKLYDEGDFDAALIELERAYELAPSFRLLFNIGRVREQLQDHAGARRAYEQYLAEGADKIAEKRREEVRATLKGLEGRTAFVDVFVAEENAEIVINDVLVGTTPLTEPVLVNAGEVLIVVSKPGRQTVRRRLRVAAGERQRLTMELQPLESTPVAPVTPPTESAPKPQPTPPAQDKPAEARGFPWLAWGITGVLGASAAVTGLLALSADSDLDELRNTPNADREDLDSESSRVQTLATLTDVLVAATLISGGVSLYLTLDAGGPPSTAAEQARSPTQLRLQLGAGSVALRGRF